MKAALISGAAGGMGVATTSAFLNAGWCVFACDNDEDRLVELTSECREPKRVASAALDLGEASSCTEAVRLAVERYGRLDALVNMAGIGGPQAGLETLTPEDWSKILNTNLMSAVFLTTAAIPHLKEDKRRRGQYRLDLRISGRAWPGSLRGIEGRHGRVHEQRRL